VAKEENGNRQSGALNMTDVRTLARILKQYDLSSLEVELEGASVRLHREHTLAPIQAQAVPMMAAAPEPASPLKASADQVDELPDDGSVEVTSPFVGTFYRAPAPDSDPYVEESKQVVKGDILCIVEAMKLMNELECETPGKITKILVQNGDVVEFGQALFHIMPSA
jgi:acetyl-CoA carboxylase biotin carboxyl carrier protein